MKANRSFIGLCVRAATMAVPVSMNTPLPAHIFYWQLIYPAGECGRAGAGSH